MKRVGAVIVWTAMGAFGLGWWVVEVQRTPPHRALIIGLSIALILWILSTLEVISNFGKKNR